MADDSIQELVEKFSCDLVLADPQEPESLSGMLPLLKKIHDECRKTGLSESVDDMLQAKEIINSMIQDQSSDTGDQMGELKEIADRVSIAVKEEMDDEPRDSDEISRPEEGPALKDPGAQIPFDESSTPENPAEDSEEDKFEHLENKLLQFGDLIAQFCPGEIPDLGAMLNALDDLIEVSENIQPTTFHDISNVCKEYVETITLENIYNTKPIEEGLVLLKSILSHLRRKEEFIFDYSDVLEMLQTRFKDEQEKTEKDRAAESESTVESIPDQAEPVPISEDDMEILVDFVSEAKDNLELIEVNLIELEHDPSNMDIINDIFRPFHTIKGVSGFLSLGKINKLSHATENLLDSARSGDIIIGQAATDAILNSVDVLKRLIDRIGQSVSDGMLLPDNDVDVAPLLKHLQAIQSGDVDSQSQPLGEILLKKNAVDRQVLEEALAQQKETPDKKIGEILVENKGVSAQEITSALAEQNSAKKRMDTQVKVSTRKLDDLVDYAGELVIAQSMLRQQTAQNPSLAQSVAQLGQIVTNMQTIAMSMRMIPIKATFMKMIRLVRDLSKKSGKKVSLNMSGEETEIDRNVVDALYEPMVHMIRNSVDHGIEPLEKRVEKEKSQKGEINLRAYHKGGHIIIEIEDDGKGLDKERILEKALSTGLITGKEQMTDSQIYELIMEPGFSTAKTITDVSGRGVGMDVVKSGIEKFRGHLNIESTKDQGTKFTISLPLTLAIIDGMLVQVSGERYVIPTTAIQKAFRPGPKDYFTVEGKGEMVKDRGNLVPLIRLDELYNDGTSKRDISESLVVVVESKEQKRALLIDELLGKDEYVIKSLGSNLENIQGLAGGAILADGQVGLILDIHGVFSLAAGADSGEDKTGI